MSLDYFTESRSVNYGP